MEAVYYHLEATVKSLNSLDFFVEYCSRYEVFRNAIVDLEEKVGFLFTHFDQTFSHCFPQYLSIPHFSLWRIAAKMWTQRTICFHELCSKICSALWLRERELDTCSFI